MSETPAPYLPYGNETIEVCISLPYKVNSAGIWENLTSPSVIFTYSLPLLEIQMLFTFFVIRLVYAILKPLGVTFFASQMFAGMILGPAMLGKLEPVEDILFTPELGTQIIDTAAVFGFTIFLFLMGVKMDVRVAFKTTKRAVVIGIVSLLWPILVGLLVYELFNKPDHGLRLKHLFGATIQSLTSFSVIAYLLGDLKIINSELGRIALSSACIGDLATIFIIFSIATSTIWQESKSLALASIVIMALFIILVFFVFRPLMFQIIKTTPEGKPIKESYILVIILVALGCGVFTNLFNRSPLIGPFLFGLAVPDGPPLGSALVDKFECFANGIFLAVFVTTSTMRVNPKEMFSDPSNVKFTIIFVVFTFLAKLISCFIASFLSIMPWRDSLAFSLIMSSKGVVELSYFSSFKENKIMSEATFSVMVLSILINATFIPFLVRFLYDPVSRKYAGYQKRNLEHLKPNTELRILACIHTPENVPPLIDFLNLSCPTKESPNIIYALHLIELVARDSPIFIAHKKQEDIFESSFQHIVALNKYEQKSRGLVTLNAFTTISPSKLMHEDINIMALKKQANLIILPFHRIWSMDGCIEVENKVIRNLNCTVLNQAPCSIGIIVDRGMVVDRRRKSNSSSSLSSYYIGMLFLGGKDDREALTLAKRMAQDARVKLTVIHLIADNNYDNIIDWDMMLDAEILKDIKQNNNRNGCDTTYVEQVSNDGPQAARIVQSLANDYDLMIVGRRYMVDSVQTKGLSDWSEFPELGVVGDLLVSTDLDSKVSVLVVQQQQYVGL